MPASADHRTLAISLKPKTEARLRAIAAARGVSVDEYLATALERVVDDAVDESGFVDDSTATRRPFDPARWDAAMRALSEDAESIPILYDEDLTRAVLYGDYD